MRGRLRSAFVPFLIVATAWGLVPAVAATSPTSPLPRVAFVARNDVPFDALGVGAVAGSLGGIVVITSPGALSATAESALKAYGPDLVVIAGGTAAITSQTEAAIAAAGPWDVRRIAGEGRDQTAAAVGALLAELGAGRPVLTPTGPGAVLGASLVDVHHVSAGGTPAENGAALRAVIEKLGTEEVDWRVVHIGPGTFSLGATPLNVPAQVTLVGSGDTATRLESTATTPKSAFDSGAIVLQVGAGLRDLLVQASASGEDTTAVFMRGYNRLERVIVISDAGPGNMARGVVAGLAADQAGHEIDGSYVNAMTPDTGSAFALWVRSGFAAVTGTTLESYGSGSNALRTGGVSRVEFDTGILLSPGGGDAVEHGGIHTFVRWSRVSGSVHSLTSGLKIAGSQVDGAFIGAGGYSCINVFDEDANYVGC